MAAVARRRCGSMPCALSRREDCASMRVRLSWTSASVTNTSLITHLGVSWKEAAKTAFPGWLLGCAVRMYSSPRAIQCKQQVTATECVRGTVLAAWVFSGNELHRRPRSSCPYYKMLLCNSHLST
eukprot:3776692-Amphidinium_carterae.3